MQDIYEKARKSVENLSVFSQEYFDAYCEKKCAKCSCYAQADIGGRRIEGCLLAQEAKLVHIYRFIGNLIEEGPWPQ